MNTLIKIDSCIVTLDEMSITKLPLYGDYIYDWKTNKSKILAACSCHVTYAFQNESTLYIWLNVKELVAQNRCDI